MNGTDHSNRRRRRAHPSRQSTNGETLNEITHHKQQPSNSNGEHDNHHEVDFGEQQDDKGHTNHSLFEIVFNYKRTTSLNPCHRFWFWCLETKNTIMDKFSKLSRNQIRLLVCAKMILFLLKLWFLHWLFKSTVTSSKPFFGRSLSDEGLNEIPLMIPAFDFSGDNETDIGGWRHPRRFFKPPVLSDEAIQNQTMPDFGGLLIFRNDMDMNMSMNMSMNMCYSSSSLESSNLLLAPKRQIHPDDARLAQEHWEKETDKGYVYIHSYDLWPEDVQDEKHECRYPNWVKQYHPSCNNMHDLSLLDRSDKHYVSHGTFRDVWLVDHASIPNNNNNNNNPKSEILLKQSALKMSRWYIDYKHGTYMAILNDAMVMERLAMSPRIVDIYGHCGTSVWVEPMPGDIEGVAVPGDGLIQPKYLHDKDAPQSQNSYTTKEKFEMALTMAESLADLHGFRDGIIVHDDVQVAQFLKTPDGRLKFGDFNRATILKYDSKHEVYCQYSTSGRGWRNRAPEEYARNFARDDPDKGWMDEKIDVYSYGNGIYALLTGLWVFYDVDDDLVPRQMVYNGTTPYVDPRWKEQGFLTSKLVEVMEECWAYNATQRISIFQVVEKLREAKKEHERMIMTTPSGNN
eukprot:CAMPEP_0116135316 /NCGR_PEP_ID=MMETSP0329-20121206/11126_1 /TAXON_ID=697910 /ORGANISM="Pseudo-nitzschia arenysensis, Strain B593" /LENGTH=626 /DNA_ID=CAMNT_0003630109 /DNA_START=178 /DNA_END=2055 /DNA_ORIENTATION=-